MSKRLASEITEAAIDKKAKIAATESGESRNECVHEIGLPPGKSLTDFPKSASLSYPSQPVRTYPFTLDPFQRVAISAISAGDSTLVAAHTSAGKTVIAEYAVADALAKNSRVIYTSPIKALSNQKYRDLQEDFGDVGLMTGDITINQTASCLVMTTEILRSMLYRGSELMKEVSYVIFDEAHYMRDKERGVVWEESIILLPDTVRFVFLSATLANALEFAEWVAALHSHPVHVVYTEQRPVPLQHYLYPAGGDGLHLVVDEKGAFREDNFKRALDALANADNGSSSRGRGQRRTSHRERSTKTAQAMVTIVEMLMKRNYEPVIIFAFSKRECETFALALSRLDFSTEDEKELINSVFENALATLSEEDRKLPQVQHILPLLRRGIGIHHGGLLPLLKEVIEILFQEGLIKALFATETFSIGLNMPARTVVFASARKFDGKDHRPLMSTEYIQMSGRAGRRGKDDRGLVILTMDERLDATDARAMMFGQAGPLRSAFHLGYNMLLNMLRVEEIDPTYMIRKSFRQFQAMRGVPGLQARVSGLEGRIRSLTAQLESTPADAGAASDASTVNKASLAAISAKYSATSDAIEVLRSSMAKFSVQPSVAMRFVQPGRLVLVNPAYVTKEVQEAASSGTLSGTGAGGAGQVEEGEADEAAGATGGWGWAIVLGFERRAGVPPGPITAAKPEDVVVHLVVRAAADTTPIVPARDATNTSAELLTVAMADLVALSTIRVHVPDAPAQPANREALARTLVAVEGRFPSGIPRLDPLTDMNVVDEQFAAMVKRCSVLEERLTALRLEAQEAGGEVAVGQLDEKASVSRALGRAKRALVEAERAVASASEMILSEELTSMTRVLRRLGFITADDVLEVKGRVACEISAADELVLTELLFSGTLTKLETPVLAALLSVFVWEERGGDGVQLPEELATPFAEVTTIARRVGEVCYDCRVPMNVEEYVATFRSGLMPVVAAWSRGSSFAEVCKQTDAFEGSIIRCVRRLEELLRQLVDAAKTLGNEELENKFEAVSTSIKHDIIFAASLYL
eukprot:CAMPEP_0170743216 /NCGR_PEP_ID=MMETSP0437-20130122/7151_1 /TAXON_ID=0 /ORGANISM="Sexangularia sp." /LENGTH=1037 /DNA_ID=CAMNT_0011081873 /DNA_START=34 /DNA_END=3147 /DNA_ORIENTATION=-